MKKRIYHVHDIFYTQTKIPSKNCFLPCTKFACVEFVFAPQHETSHDLETITIEDFDYII